MLSTASDQIRAHQQVTNQIDENCRRSFFRLTDSRMLTAREDAFHQVKLQPSINHDRLDAFRFAQSPDDILIMLAVIFFSPRVIHLPFHIFTPVHDFPPRHSISQ